jgi:PII-like signaling protein
MRFHFGERDRCGDGPLDAAVMDACARRGVAAAALLRGVEGFGAKHLLRTDRLLSLSEDAPVVAVAVGTAEEIEALAEDVRELTSGGLAVLESVAVVDGGVVEDCGVVGAPEDEVKATIWGPRTGSASPHFDAVAALKRHGAAAATVLLGVDGVVEGERRRARFVASNRGVPAMTVAIGERSAIGDALAELDAAAQLVTVEAVELSSRIPRVSLHSEGIVGRNSVIDRGSHHTATRVTLVTSEIAAGDSGPLYVELIRRLREEGATGATALRGVWGFRGDGEPHGDRVLALRRDVPLVVEAVDTPERAARWREIALSLGGDQDLVYSQGISSTFALK